MTMPTPSEARVFLGPGGRDSQPHDKTDTISFYFPFAVSDAISIFTNIVVPGPDPFSVSEESRREVFWPLIKRITNYPKAVEPVLANGSMEIGDQVEALMESLDNAFNSGVKNVYINCAGTLVGVSPSLMHQFLELSEKVFHLWKNRNDAARPDEPGGQGDINTAPVPSSATAAHTRPEKASSSTPTPLLSHLPPRARSSLLEQKPHFPSSSTAELDSRPIHSAAAPLGMASSSSNPSGGQETHEFVPPFVGAGTGAGAGGDPETPAARQARIDEHTLQQQLLASHAQTLAAQSQQSQQQLGQADPAYQSATSQWLSSGAGKVPISEIWRATIYRLYNEQNESLTKYRRPNWLFHLESHQVRTIEDLGGWREDDESTRQLANNLITKLQETGYGTKGLQSRLKAITTADVRDAILNVERGGLEKYKPGPTLGKRVTPIKWSHVNPSDIPGQNIIMMETDSPTNTPGPQQPVGNTPELSGTTNEVENSLKRSTDSSAHPIRIKRKRTSSPNRESLTLVMPPDMADEKEGQQSARKGAPTAPTPAPVAPMMRPDATPQTGFTPININRSIVPAVSSVSTPAPIAPAPIAPAPLAPVTAVMATPTPVPVHHHMNTTATPPNLATPSSATRMMDIRAFAETPQRPATPSSTIDLESEQDDDDYDASMMDELVYKRLQYLKSGLESLRQEFAESKQSQADNASIIEKAAKEVFDGFTRDFHEDYRRVRNLSKENKERFDKFEAKLGSIGNVGNSKEEWGKLETKLTEDVKNLVVNKITEHDNQLVKRIDAQRLEFISEQERRSNDEAEFEQRFAKLEEKLSTLDSDVNTRFQMLENPVPAPFITSSTRRATRNSVSAPAPPVAALTTETRLRLDKLEARLEKLETQQRKASNNNVASNPADLERMAALEEKHKALEGNLNQVMEAVSGLLIQVMKEKRGSVSVFDDKKN
ncbi:hypothetical protein TWF788_010387 [Orbilia oligospora]|uniref:Uncharacterized protein n=1 Tax=Orbilia oligospora TaxID=2813651 RepID=A0A7C8PIR7_ORBOL|nr:hypothetical protein TWF788_010387 [Orbilia oligospora]